MITRTFFSRLNSVLSISGVYNSRIYMELLQKFLQKLVVIPVPNDIYVVIII